MSAPQGSAAAEEGPPTAGYGPASWRAGPRAPAPRSRLADAAWNSGRAAWPGRGGHLGAQRGPALPRGVRSAGAATAVRPSRSGSAPPPPAPRPAPPAGLGPTSFRLPGSGAKETQGWGWGPPGRGPELGPGRPGLDSVGALRLPGTQTAKSRPPSREDPAGIWNCIPLLSVQRVVQKAKPASPSLERVAVAPGSPIHSLCSPHPLHV